jgi:beta-glucanase (GH16 family)
MRGGELISNNLYGSYTARMKLPDAPSSITGFFLYEPPDYDSEIGIEIYNDSSRKIMFSTYSGGKQTYTQTLKLPFNPTNGFHDYRFDYAPGFVKFFVDGQLMKHWTTGIPDNLMKLYVNAWYPNWLRGRMPSTDQYLLVDKIQYVQH